jgi:hypothetical protein
LWLIDRGRGKRKYGVYYIEGMNIVVIFWWRKKESINVKV